MTNYKRLARLFMMLLLGVLSSSAWAEEDWLIAKVNGLWTWERAGPEGSVRKNFIHQEVLRRTADGLIVVVSALPITEGKPVNCTEKARHNPKEPCSSAFLACQPKGTALSSLGGLITGGPQGATKERGAYSCSIDIDAVLDAALAVGLIEQSELEAPGK